MAAVKAVIVASSVRMNGWFLARVRVSFMMNVSSVILIRSTRVVIAAMVNGSVVSFRPTVLTGVSLMANSSVAFMVMMVFVMSEMAVVRWRLVL